MLYSMLREVPGIEQASPSGGCHCRAMFLLIWYMLTDSSRSKPAQFAAQSPNPECWD